MFEGGGFVEVVISTDEVLEMESFEVSKIESVEETLWKGIDSARHF